MPIEEIRAVLTAPGIPARNELIAAHLSRLQQDLARTQNAVAALQDLLDDPSGPPRGQISHRSVPAARAAAITATIDVSDAGPWYQGALGELNATIGAHVTQHAIAVDGPIREYYLSGRHDTPDESAWRTEIGWPIFRTASR